MASQSSAVSPVAGRSTTGRRSVSTAGHTRTRRVTPSTATSSGFGTHEHLPRRTRGASPFATGGDVEARLARYVSGQRVVGVGDVEAGGGHVVELLTAAWRAAQWLPCARAPGAERGRGTRHRQLSDVDDPLGS